MLEVMITLTDEDLFNIVSGAVEEKKKGNHSYIYEPSDEIAVNIQFSNPEKMEKLRKLVEGE